MASKKTSLSALSWVGIAALGFVGYVALLGLRDNSPVHHAPSNGGGS